MSLQFPSTAGFSGPNRPMRLECDLHSLEVDGTLPTALDGRWFRLGPDPQFPPHRGDDLFINGDGVISAFWFGGGRADFSMRYVRTRRFEQERAAGRSLYGAYRNRFTNHPSVREEQGGTANTTPVFHGGRLLALKEDSHAVELDPVTLETIGDYSFGGALRSLTMTAHPKIDPRTGEMIFFGYEAGGDATRDVALCVVDRNGTLIEEQWFEAPYAAMMHDFAVTEHHIVFPIYPTITDRARLEAGGPHWMWNGALESHIGIMPRRGSVSDMRWFRRPAGFSYHVLNAFSEGEEVTVDLSLAEINPFPFFPSVDGRPWNPMLARPMLTRWRFDLALACERPHEERLYDLTAEMPRIDERFAMRKLRYGFFGIYDSTKPTTHAAGPAGSAFNHLGRFDFAERSMARWYAGEPCSVQEPQFVPSGSNEGEGYLLAVVNHHETNLSDVVVLDAQHIEQGPVATIRVPFRLRNVFHGTWVSSDLIPQ